MWFCFNIQGDYIDGFQVLSDIVFFYFYDIVNEVQQCYYFDGVKY